MNSSCRRAANFLPSTHFKPGGPSARHAPGHCMPQLLLPNERPSARHGQPAVAGAPACRPAHADPHHAAASWPPRRLPSSRVVLCALTPLSVSTHPKALPSRIEDEQMAAQIGPGTHNSRRSRTGCAAGEGAEAALGVGAAPGWSSVAPGEQRCRRGSCDGTRVRETSVSGWTRVPRRKQNE
jgi:hypothetical protein